MEPAENSRQIRVTSLIKEMVATFIQQESNTDPLITVTRVDVAPDYRNAKIYITTIPDGRESDALIWLKRHGGDIRRMVMKKSNLKTIPHFDFEIDFGEKHRQHTDEVFRKIEDEQEAKE